MKARLSMLVLLILVTVQTVAAQAPGPEFDEYVFGPNFTGDLQHWHYDTFRVVWRDPMQGKGFVNFRLDTQAKVEVINIENLSEFTRVPEPPTKTMTSVKE